MCVSKHILFDHVTMLEFLHCQTPRVDIYHPTFPLAKINYFLKSWHRRECPISPIKHLAQWGRQTHIIRR